MGQTGTNNKKFDAEEIHRYRRSKARTAAVLMMIVTLFSSHILLAQKPQKAAKSLQTASSDTAAKKERPQTLKPHAQHPRVGTSEPKLDERYIDSGDTLLSDDRIPIPTPLDTSNKILLPVNLKKDKFAYFDASQSIDRIVPNSAFTVGEKLTFVVRYGAIVAGSATMAIPQVTKIRGREVYQIVTEARSSAFFSAFYRVQDRVESYVDRKGLFTWRFQKSLREGNYKADRLVEYDQIHGWAVTNQRDSMRIPPCVQDVLSSFYYVRTQKLEVGKSLFIDNHSDNKLYPMEVKVHKKERIKVRAGEFDCVVVEPILRASGLFKSKGRLIIWLTDDDRRIPIQMKSKIPVGYITAELREMEGVIARNNTRKQAN
ncbi:MAG: DUF3108 domain-containing protein [candidate division KSB1 bacterium]|nr:DUF3108 domain-containing protein [candidate division KSB1 bacterium]MDZ7357646.1 DUF3108 domain-containing protein [candidate division KSB1 bacterium]MDZ7399210.1 DUF3108 domain-containing protein [candidate division KSB1 bacterium]